MSDFVVGFIIGFFGPLLAFIIVVQIARRRSSRD